MKDKIQRIIEEQLGNNLSKMFNNKLSIKNIHVHQLYDFCIRRWALAYQNKIPYSENSRVDTGTLLTRAIGIKYEELAYEILSFSLKDKIRHKFNLKYNIIDDINLVGEIDIVLGSYIVEIKSMKPDDFDSGIPDRYVKQVQNYLALAKLCNTKIKEDKGYLISFCKLQKKNPFKVYMIEKDDNCLKKIEKIIKEVPKALKKIPKRICNSKHCYTAKNCSLKEICFKKEDI